MSLSGLLLVGFLAILALSILCVERLLTVLSSRRPRRSSRATQDAAKATHLLIVLGSGGHTAEMISMLERALTEKNPSLRLDWSTLNHRSWIVSSGDAISAERARKLEDLASSLANPRQHDFDGSVPSPSFDIITVPRARRIHQPLYTTPFSSVQCLFSCLYALCGWRSSQNPRSARFDFPDVIICNGPATAAILILASIILRFFNTGGCHTKGKMRTIYIESWARVKKLSLSGTLLYPVVDRFLVQWPQLVRPGGRAEYLGVLV